MGRISSNILVSNSFRIFGKSKTLILTLGSLLSVGTIITSTIINSTYLMSESKNHIIQNGNPSDLTITIPKDQLSSDANNDQDDISNGKTLADLKLQTFLTSNNFNYTFSKNLSMSDITSGNNFLLSLANSDNSLNTGAVNKLLIDSGNPIPNSTLSNDNQIIINAEPYFYNLRQIKRFPNDKNLIDSTLKLFEYQNYLNAKPWVLAKILSNSQWKLENTTANKIVSLIEPLTSPPLNYDDYMKNYYPFQDSQITPNNIRWNPNSYFYKLAQLFSVYRVVCNGFGYEISCLQTIPLLGMGNDVVFSVNYNDKSSYFSIINPKFLEANNKSILDSRTIQDVIKLPFKVNSIPNHTNLDQSYKVYDQDTGEYQLWPDFLSWFNNLNDKYKIKINSLDYLISGTGNCPDYLYPVTNEKQMLINTNNNTFLFVNSLGFNRATFGSSYDPMIYYFVRYPPDLNTTAKNELFNELKNYTINEYGYNTVYSINDKNQPNKILYIWANFLNNIQNIIYFIGLALGFIILVLVLIFVSLLIRSIIKINKSTFGILLANGHSKLFIAASFFPFALFPAIIFGFISWIASYFLTSPFLNIINNYWSLSIDKPKIYWWSLLIIIGLLFAILYIIIIFTSLAILRGNSHKIINNNSSFKVNNLVLYTKSITNKFPALLSFRFTFMMNSLGRFIILLFSVITIISLISIIGGTANLFNNAIYPTIENKNYLVAYDLYSPTINSGYYSAIPYDQLGTSQQGDYNTYSVLNNTYERPLNANSDYYNGVFYDSALSYPYENNLWFTSLFMPNFAIANQINFNFQILNNKVCERLLLDIDINALGAPINPWDFAKQVLPDSIIYLSEQNNEDLVETNYDFYYWLQQQNNTTEPIHIDGLENTEFAQFNDQNITYQSYLPNVYGQPFTLDNSDLTSDYLTAPNQNQWILMKKFDQTKDKYVWALNTNFAVNSAPSFTIKPKTVELLVEMLTNNENPLFQMWYKYIYDKNLHRNEVNQIIPEHNYKFALGVVPVDLQDEVYTYLDTKLIDTSNDSKINKNIKIFGIGENSNHIKLFDNKNNNLFDNLNNYVVKSETIDNNGVKSTIYTYPLVINKIVHLKNGWNNGDVLTVSISNTFDRFNLKNIGQDPNYICKFEIVGILDTNYDNQYYTLQKYANQILGYQPTNSSANLSNQWTDRIHPASSYVPFNGVFSSDPNFKMIKNFGGLYSPSGLSTIVGSFGQKVSLTEDLGAMGSLLNNNSTKLDELVNIDKFVDRENNNMVIQKEITPDESLNFTADWGGPNSRIILNRLIDLFEQSTPMVTQIQQIDSPYINLFMGTTLDNVVRNIEIAILLSIIPTILIVISLLAIIIIFESKRLISLMAILGYSNCKNIFSFMFVYLVVWLFGTLLSVPIIYGLFELIKYVSFNYLNILVTPLIPYIPFIIGIASVGIIFLSLFIFIYTRIKKVNLPQEISINE